MTSNKSELERTPNYWNQSSFYSIDQADDSQSQSGQDRRTCKMPESDPPAAKDYVAAVIVTSDSCSQDPSKDESGPLVVDHLIQTGLFKQVDKVIVGDDRDRIVAHLKKTLISSDPALIITVGGTGLCPRDVTPEATSSLYERHCSGITTALHMTSLRYVPHAALSRLTAGTVGATLIINFPGKPRACEDCFSCLAIILKHALEQVRFNHQTYSATHRQQQLADLGKPLKRAATPNHPGLSTSLSSLASSNGQRKFGTQKQRWQARKPPPAPPKSSRSSSEVSSAKLTIEAIAESRNEISGLEHSRSASVSSAAGQAKPPTKARIVPKKFNKKLVDQVANSLNSLQVSNPDPTVVQTPKPAQLRPLLPTLLPDVKILKSQSSYELIDYNQSLQCLAAVSACLFKDLEDIVLSSFRNAYNCIGATLAEDIRPKRLMPPYNVCTMDGYVLNVHSALKAAINQIKTPPLIPVVANLQEFEKLQLAKDSSKQFFCYQINTGGRLPRYNFAIIPAEKAFRVDDNNVKFEEIKHNYFIRKAGSDINEQDVIKTGTIIGPVELSLIVAMGHKRFKINPRPKIGVMSTGDEIEDFFQNEFINQDSVADMNGPMLSSLFRSQGYFVVGLGVAPDKPNVLLQKMQDALDKCDVLLLTGGASMGAKDHVKDVIKHMGGTIHFGRVNIKPGKPVAFASIMVKDKRKFIFSLPGNPVSAYVTALVLVLPFLRHGAERYLPKPRCITEHVGEKIWVKVAAIEGNENYRFDGRLDFLRAKTISKEKEFCFDTDASTYSVCVSTKQNSSCLFSLVDCDCLVMVDPAKKGQLLTKGDIYAAFKLNLKY